MARYLLIVILAIAVFLRAYHVSTNPPGFFCDEVSVGYNAYLIANTGKDEWHNSFPIFFKAFGEYRNPLEVYATIPAVQLFGINAFSVRITSVAFSIATIIVFYLIGTVWSPWLGIVLAAIAAVTPWSVHMGRTGFVAENIYLFCVSLSLYFLIRARQKKRYILLFFVSCTVGIYSYFSAYAIYPILVVSGIIFLWKIVEKKYLFAGLILFYVLAIPLAVHMWNGNGIKRFKQVSFLRSDMNPAYKFAKSYTLHFSPRYLFVESDKDGVLRHSLIGVGELLIWELPGLLWGIYFLWKRKTGIGKFILLLFVIYPIPSSLTDDLMPLATRSIMGVVPFTFIVGYGYYELMRYWYVTKRRSIYYLSVALMAGLFIGSSFYITHLLTIYAQESGGYQGWQYGMEDSIRYLKAHQKEYHVLNITHRFNSPEELLKFYNRTLQCNTCRIMSNPIVVDRHHKQLFAIRKEDIWEAYEQYEDVEFIKLKTIRDPSGKAQLFIGYFVFTSLHSGK